MRLPADQAADVVAYLHALLSLSDSAGDSGPSSSYSLKLLLTGNAEQGRAFFNGKGGCAGCHSPQGDLAQTAPFVETDWASNIDGLGRPVPAPEKGPQPDGVLVRANMDGATNWMAPSFDPETRLFYVNTQSASSLWYLVLNDDHKPDGHQGGTLSDFWSSSQLKALDYETGKTVWQRDLGKGHSFTGVLTTAGRLLFSGDTSGNVFALDPANGNTLWHVYAGGTLNSSPRTYQIDGRRYLITPIDSVVYAWTVPGVPQGH